MKDKAYVNVFATDYFNGKISVDGEDVVLSPANEGELDLRGDIKINGIVPSAGESYWEEESEGIISTDKTVKIDKLQATKITSSGTKLDIGNVTVNNANESATIVKPFSGKLNLSAENNMIEIASSYSSGTTIIDLYGRANTTDAGAEIAINKTSGQITQDGEASNFMTNEFSTNTLALFEKHLVFENNNQPIQISVAQAYSGTAVATPLLYIWGTVRYIR